VPEVPARPIPRGVGLALIAGIAVLFASNHVAARLAFDHGTSVVTAVLVRSAVTALAVAVLLRATATPWSLAAPTRRHAVLIGLVLSVQSVCLYASVARIPVALALLTFNSFPVVLALLSWATGGDGVPSSAGLVGEVVGVGLGGFFKHAAQRGLLFAGLGLAGALGRGNVFFGHLQAVLLGQVFDGLDKVHAQVVHQKTHGVAVRGERPHAPPPQRPDGRRRGVLSGRGRRPPRAPR
jgi:drug/metabolite transporter (DMT)-like permease